MNSKGTLKRFEDTDLDCEVVTRLPGIAHVDRLVLVSQQVPVTL